jgi:hypothetical protein
MALRGITPVEITRRVNRAGWQTVPRRHDYRPGPFTPARIRQLLENPRYAGLSVYRGEVVGPGNWPAYVNNRQWDRLQRRQANRSRPWIRHPEWPRAGFLLRHLCRCAACGSSMSSITNPPRRDGTRSRRYSCDAARQGSCQMRWVDAQLVDAVFVANLHTFLGFEARRPSIGGLPRADPFGQVEPTLVHAEQLRRAIITALSTGDNDHADELLDQLVAHRTWIVSNQRQAPTLGDHERPAHELLLDFYAWSTADLDGRAADETKRADHLNRLLRGWFDHIEIGHSNEEVILRPTLRPPTSARYDKPDELLGPPVPSVLRTSKTEWAISLRAAGIGHRHRHPWHTEEILDSMRHWAIQHGRSPRFSDWLTAGPDHPNHTTVFHHFGRWTNALQAANLPPSAHRAHRHALRDAAGRFTRTP